LKEREICIDVLFMLLLGTTTKSYKSHTSLAVKRSVMLLIGSP